MRNLCIEDEMNEILSIFVYEEFINLEWSNCIYCIEGQSLFDCVNIFEGWNGGFELEFVFFDSDKYEEIFLNEIVYEQCMVKVVDRKVIIDGCFSECLFEDYCYLFVIMFYVVLLFGQVFLQFIE